VPTPRSSRARVISESCSSLHAPPARAPALERWRVGDDKSARRRPSARGQSTTANLARASDQPVALVATSISRMLAVSAADRPSRGTQQPPATSRGIPPGLQTLQANIPFRPPQLAPTNIPREVRLFSSRLSQIGPNPAQELLFAKRTEGTNKANRNAMLSRPPISPESDKTAPSPTPKNGSALERAEKNRKRTRAYAVRLPTMAG